LLAVIFEVYPSREGKAEYLQIAAGLRGFLQDRDGFISIERFQSLSKEGKILSLSFWRDEEAVKQWCNLLQYRVARQRGRSSLFSAYRFRVAEVIRGCSADDCGPAPEDSNQVLR